MSRNLAHAMSSSELATASDPVCWRRALKTFLDTLSSPRTVRAYERAVTEAMEAMEADLVADLTPPMLAEYRAGLVARLSFVLAMATEGGDGQ